MISLAELGLSDSLPMPKRNDWGIGMVGYGGFGGGQHAPAYRKVGWSLVAVADPDPSARQRALDEGAQRVYASADELVLDPRVEIVDLQTQPNIREDVVRLAAQAKKPVVTAKPMANSMEECERLVSLAEKGGIVLAVHQNYRWMAANYAVREMLEKGMLGDPALASIEIYGTQDRDLAGHPYYSSCRDFMTIQWNNHLADLLRYWAGSDAHRVWARTSRGPAQNFASDMVFHSLHDFDHGLTGSITHSELLRSSLGGVQCRVDGTKGSAVFDFYRDHLVVDCEATDGPQGVDLSPLSAIPSVAGSMADVMRALESGTEPAVSGRRNLATLRAVFAEHESTLRGGEWMPLI